MRSCQLSLLHCALYLSPYFHLTQDLQKAISKFILKILKGLQVCLTLPNLEKEKESRLGYVSQEKEVLVTVQ